MDGAALAPESLISGPVTLSVVTISALFTVFGVAAFIRGLAVIIGRLRAGAPDHTRANRPLVRIWTAFVTIVSHRTFKGRPVVRIAHWLVMFSFIVLVTTLAQSYVQLAAPWRPLPFFGSWAPWLWVTEFFAWAGLLGIIALMGVRWWGSRGGRTSRFYGSTTWQAVVVEWVILLVCLLVLLLHALDFTALLAESAATGQALPTGLASPWARYASTSWLGYLFAGWSLPDLLAAIQVLSAAKIVVSMIWMGVVGVQTSMGVAWHRFLAPFNLLFGISPDGRKSLGPLPPILIDGRHVPDLDAVLEADAASDEPEPDLGLGTTAGSTWKDRLDFYSCTECGRCQAVCPAWNTQKPLSPKLLTMSLRDNVASTGPAPVPTGTGTPDSFDLLGALAASGNLPDGVAAGATELVPGVVSPEALWDCTMCGACVEQCPVDIEHVDRIAGLRRYQVLMESAFPRELQRAFKGMETKGNPYAGPPRKRLEWARRLDFDVPVVGQDLEDASQVDYLFWVGCAGAYDDRAKKTTAAVAELLHTAGVSFAVLGNAESCTGDPARRAGNEVLFQMLASAAIDTLDEAAAQRIVVTCPHCFNTIANEYPQLGGHYEVVHHTQLLNRLVRDGKLRPVAPPPEEALTVTYQDPCFLGRHNRVFSPPRELLGGLPGVEFTEMAHHGAQGICCGAGGARAWMEETRGSRIADQRMDEAVDTGAAVLATACPFCTQMLDSASSAVTGSAAAGKPGATGGLAAGPQVRDVAQLLLDGVRRGAAGSPHRQP